MEQSVLAQFDEEYLVGISNKGIVKRAHKDMEAGIACSLTEHVKENQWQVAVGEEQVTVVLPIAESKCSCPSRSICRHVIQAVLYLQQTIKDGEGKEKEVEVPLTEQASKPDSACIAPRKKETTDESTKDNDVLRLDAEEEEAVGNRSGKGTGESVADGMESQEKQTAGMPGQLMEEIRDYPLKKLTRALGVRGYRNFMAKISSAKPVISYGSVITVKLTEQNVTVKLLSPLEYSSCTCHKKELCAHKAEAVLWCRLEQGSLSEELLAGMEAGEAGYDIEQIEKVSEELEAFVEDVFLVGLSRCAKDVLGHLERLAILCHNAGLAGYEGYCRGLKDSYERYFRHSAVFEVETLLSRLIRLSHQAKALRQAKDNTEIAALAGEFREDYLPVGNLDLVGITMEHFVTQTGYEGDTIYFLEKQKGKWYTYSNVRPTFYESKRKGFTEKVQAPWQLPMTLEELYKVTLHISRAKCDERGRLSGSLETKAEVMGKCSLEKELIKDWYFDDFATLYQKWFREEYEERRGKQNLVFVDAYEMDEAKFSETEQSLTLIIYDKMGKELVIKVDYSKQEESTIRYLEQLKRKEHYCFLGRIYLKNGRIYMYPVALYKGSENPYYEEKKELFR